MSADPKQLPILRSQPTGQESRQILLDAASNELIFGVVGHAGSGTTVIAEHLQQLLMTTSVNGKLFDVELIKARELIKDWAIERKLPFPASGPLAQSTMLQNYGDMMRAEKTKTGPDHAAVAKALILKIRKTRAAKVGVSAEGTDPVAPDGNPRAYILDSIRHSAEVQLLRNVYKHAFILIGVVCEEKRRISRLEQKFKDGDEQDVIKFMERDADDTREKHGQHVADAFQLADYYLDNTVERMKEGESNPDWDVVEELSRLMKILTHSELLRPRIGETAMHHAYSAKMRSACLSRQVGTAVVDAQGNVVATGTNEVPKAGGGVYGEAFENRFDFRCAMFPASDDRYCRNTREQNEIINELFEKIAELKSVGGSRRNDLITELRKTRIGQLVEFSRAVHAEMDALLSAARQGISLVGTRMFVTTFPCHYCARHIVAAGVDEVQFIEPYPKSKALSLHEDAIAVERSDWKPPSQGGQKVLFRPFSGVAPQLYQAAFLKDRDLKNKLTGEMKIGTPDWGIPWQLSKISYIELEVALLQEDRSDEKSE